MRVLVDTHVFLWANITPDKLSARAYKIISSQANALVLSAASAWEIATKVRVGKLPGAERLEQKLIEIALGSGYTLLPIEADTALRAGRMMGAHRDPFDRIDCGTSIRGGHSCRQ